MHLLIAFLLPHPLEQERVSSEANFRSYFSWRSSPFLLLLGFTHRPSLPPFFPPSLPSFQLHVFMDPTSFLTYDADSAKSHPEHKYFCCVYDASQGK
mgnify:CR=1 FL=1